MCGTGSPRCSTASSDIDPPVISKFNNEDSPILTIALSGERSLRELTEVADKMVKVRLERRQGSARCAWSANWIARSMCGSTPTGWLPTKCRSRPCVTQSTTERQHPRRQCHERSAGRSTAYHGPIVDPQAFNDLVVATVNGAPIRVRDIGSAEDGTKEQRSLSRFNGVPTVQLQNYANPGPTP